MFANYNYDKFPIVYVTFSDKIDSEEDFDLFLNDWLQLYRDAKDFSFIFDTRQTCDINIKYCFKMAMFIKKLRKENYHYLQKSLILVNTNYVKRLLDVIFTLQSPVAPVYIWGPDLNESDLNESDNIYKKCNEITPQDAPNCIYIEANKSFIPFL